MADSTIGIHAGVDTHKDGHVAAVADHACRIIEVGSFGADPAGYRRLEAWMRSGQPPAGEQSQRQDSRRSPVAGSWSARYPRTLVAQRRTSAMSLWPPMRRSTASAAHAAISQAIMKMA